jgi:predicted phosphodiesterase
MKILLLADLHAGLSPDNLEKLKTAKFDVVVTLGDIGETDLQTLLKNFDSEFFGVYGNHDDFSLDKLGIKECDFSGGLAFIHGAHSYKEGVEKYKKPQFLTQKESISIAKKLPPAKILFSHDCAFGSPLTDEIKPYSYPTGNFFL